MSNPSKVLSTVQAIHSFGTGVYQVDFSVPVRFNRFIPGQFLHLTLEEFDPTAGFWPESRVFSIASEPKLETVSIVYSVKGVYTHRMEKELHVGKEVWLKYPYGDFIIDEEAQTAPLVLIAGGTGVSPFMPFLLKSMSGPRTRQVHLYYGLREPEHLLFGQQFHRLVTELPNFSLQVYLEKGNLPAFQTRAGRLSISEIQLDLNEGFQDSIFYLSGPPVMIKAFKQDLTGRGIAEQQIQIDEWE